MRRCLMALVLLVGMVSLSHAEYILIRIVVKPGPDATKGKEEPSKKDAAEKIRPEDMKQIDYVQVVVDGVRMPITIPEFGKKREFQFFESKASRSPFETKTYRTPQYFDGEEVFMQLINSKVLKSPSAQYTDRRNQLLMGKDLGLDRYLELAIWCLDVGLVDRCMEVLGEIERMAGNKDPAPSQKVVQALAAFKKVQPIITGEIAKMDKATIWKQKLRFANVATKRHFALIHNSDDPERDGVNRRLDALETNLRGFYLAFAIRGKALPAPREKLVAILATDAAVFRKVMQVFDVPERLTDGFHGRFENLVVFSPTRLDKASERFDQEIRAIAQTHVNIDLLRGKLRPINKETEIPTAIKHVLEDFRAQVYALVEVALREESETATATHEGARQLAVETGLLPHNVDLPEWLRYGFASLFELPKGPISLENPSAIEQVFWPSIGGPHHYWRRFLDEMIQGNLLPEQPTEALFKTLTGEWFAHARHLQGQPNRDKAKIDHAGEAETEVARGRCLSWALMYFLFNERFTDLMHFFGELGNLPRDVELDQFTFLKLFCESFHIDTAGLTPMNLNGNLSAYGAFSKDWLDALRRAPAPVIPPLHFEEPKIEMKKVEQKK